MNYKSMKKQICSSLIISLCFLIVGPTVVARPMYPKDEAKQDPSLLTFRSQLLSAVERKDSSYITSILDTRVLTGLGGGVGKANFQKYWDLTNKSSSFWPQFKFAITHGGYFDKDNKQQKKFNAPYANFFFPDEDGTDTEDERAIVMQKAVPLRGKPQDSGTTETLLNYDLVKIADEENTGHKDWIKVKTMDGKQGYLRASVLIRQTSPYAEFQKHNGKWFLTWFGSASP
jgi:hypothetical protein